jgi:hypothetical protein
MVAAGEEIIDDITAGPDLDLYGNMSPDGFTAQIMRRFPEFRHRPYLNGDDNRNGGSGPGIARIIHWHGLENPSLPLLAAGYLGGETPVQSLEEK